MRCDVAGCPGEAEWHDPVLEERYCDDCAEWLTARFDTADFDRL